MGTCGMNEFGTELRRLCAERGLSTYAVARQVPCDASYITHLCIGRKHPSERIAQRLDEVLQADGHLAALMGTPVVRMPRITAAWEDDQSIETISVPCRTPDGRIIFAMVPRRTFLQGIGAAAMVVSWPPLAADVERRTELFLRVLKLLRDLDNLSGPREVIPLAAHHVTVMQQLRNSAGGPDLRELMATQVQFADLLGWLYQDCANYRTAGQWLDRALGWSHVTGDIESAAFILARKSQLAGDVGDAADAVALGGAAIRLAGATSRIGAVAATYASLGHALAGNREACDRLCDQARSALEAASGDSSPWAQFFDAAYIDVYHARGLAALGAFEAAAGRFREAVDCFQSTYYRDRGVYLAREAAAYAGAGEAEYAAGVGIQALAIGAETRSARIFAELANLERALPPASSAPPVASFRAAMDAAVLNPTGRIRDL